MAIDCGKRCKPNFFSAGKQNFSLNKAKKTTFFEKFGSIPTFRSRRKGKKCFCDKPITQHLYQVFLISLEISRFFRSYFVLPNFWSLRNLRKQLFHLRLLDMRLVISKSALRASLAIDHLISIARPWNNCELYNAIENEANQNEGKSLHIRRYFTKKKKKKKKKKNF